METISGVRLAVGCALLAAVVSSGCSRAGGATDAQADRNASANAQRRDANDAPVLSGPALHLERIRRQGEFEEFVVSARRAVEAQPDDASLLLLNAEAQLAVGENDDAAQSARRAAEVASAKSDAVLAALSVKLWTVARLRLGASLEAPEMLSTLAQLPVDEPATSMLRFWQSALQGRSTYRFTESLPSEAELRLSHVSKDSLAAELAAVEARVNGTTLPVVFIDTGGQHTLMTSAAAKSAGVRLGVSSTQLTGFVGLSAQAGLIDRLELGSLVLHDVPVLVGDSPALIEARGQMSLGTDIMHHVRFTIDYPARTVTVESASTAATRDESFADCWTIPVWTFHQICLARGELADGTPARVLVDTGNPAGTFVSYQWGRHNLPQLAGPSAAMVFRYKKRDLSLNMLTLGNQSLANWPVVDTIPTELDRLHQVDIMLGRDLLAPYRLTIDLPARVLHLCPGQIPPDAVR